MWHVCGSECDKRVINRLIMGLTLVFFTWLLVGFQTNCTVVTNIAYAEENTLSIEEQAQKNDCQSQTTKNETSTAGAALDSAVEETIQQQVIPPGFEEACQNAPDDTTTVKDPDTNETYEYELTITDTDTAIENNDYEHRNESVDSTGTAKITSTASTPTVETDKEDYLPGETVTLTGKGFIPGLSYTIIIINKLGLTVMCRLIVVDDEGKFKAEYTVPTDGTSTDFYSVKVEDSSGQIVAATTFLDSPGNIHIVTSSILIDPSLQGSTGDEDGEPPVVINAYADPSKVIFGVRITVPDGTILENTTATLTYNGWGTDNLIVDGDNPRQLGSLASGDHYVYWSLAKDQAYTHLNGFEHFTTLVEFDGGDYSSYQTLMFGSSAQTDKNHLDWLETYQSPTTGRIGDTFTVSAAYKEPVSNYLDQLAAQTYYDGSTVRLKDVSQYYYDQNAFNSESFKSNGGVQPGWTTEYDGIPYLGYGQMPSTLNASDFWITKFTYEILDYNDFLLTPYLQSYKSRYCEQCGDHDGIVTWKVDSGYAGFQEGPVRIYGFCYRDINSNGQREVDETMMSGVTVNLLDGNDQLLQSTTSNDYGYYEFINLVAGDYKVLVDPPAGYGQSGSVPVQAMLSCGQQKYMDLGLITTIPDVTITKQGPAEAAPSDTLTYTVTVTNNGSGNAYNTTVTDTLPDGTIATENIGTLLPGESNTVTFSYQVPSDTPDNTTLTNTASVTCTDKETNGNQYQADSNEVLTIVKAPANTDGGSDNEGLAGGGSTTMGHSINQTMDYDLRFEISVDKSSAEPGDILTYTIRYKNIGNGIIHNVVIDDVIPGNCSYIIGSATNNGRLSENNERITWNIEELKVGEEGAVSFKVQIVEIEFRSSSLDNNRMIVNTATIVADEFPQQRSASATTEIFSDQSAAVVKGEQEENPDQATFNQGTEEEQDAAAESNSGTTSSISSIQNRRELPYTGMEPLQILIIVIGYLMLGLGLFLRLRFR